MPNPTVAEYAVNRLVELGIGHVFGLPGDFSFPFDDAIEANPDLTWILSSNELNAAYSADGYARMSGKPACALFHLGPGLSNALANLHNACRARVPLVNIVGEHATYHRQYDAPLTADIEMLARQYSKWMRASPSSASSP